MGSTEVVQLRGPDESEDLGWQLRLAQLAADLSTKLRPWTDALKTAIERQPAGARVGLASHSNPDADAVASIVGAELLVARWGRTPVAVFPRSCPGAEFQLHPLLVKHLKNAAEPGSAPPATILFDTANWRSAGLTHPPVHVLDNHHTSGIGHSPAPPVAAISSVVTAALLSDGARPPEDVARETFGTPEGRRLAALLIMGIVLDSRYVPRHADGLSGAPTRLPGMTDADWQAFSLLKLFADDSILQDYDSSAFAVLAREYIADIIPVLGSNPQPTVVLHIGEIDEAHDGLRAVVADACTIPDHGTQDPLADLAITTSHTGDTVRISARSSVRAGQRLEIWKIFTELGREFGSKISWGIRNGTVGGALVRVTPPLTVQGVLKTIESAASDCFGKDHVTLQQYAA